MYNQSEKVDKVSSMSLKGSVSVSVVELALVGSAMNTTNTTMQESLGWSQQGF